MDAPLARPAAVNSTVRDRAFALARSWQAALVVVLAVIAVVHIPTFDYWFYNDDYVPFAEIARADSSWDYVWRLLTVQDITPNWRVMPGLVYLAGYKTFGMDQMAADSFDKRIAAEEAEEGEDTTDEFGDYNGLYQAGQPPQAGQSRRFRR
jgi:hypothetical protein